MFNLHSVLALLRPPATVLAGGALLLTPLSAQDAPAPAAPAADLPTAVEAAKGAEVPAPTEAEAKPEPTAPADPPADPTGDPPAAPAPTMPDPLVMPLDDPPVATDLLTEGAPPTPTESVVVNLINRLVERGVLTQGDAAELVSQAQRDAAIAAQNAAAAALVAADAAMASEEDIVVTHIPEPVKERLREEIKRDLVAEMPQRVAYVEEGEEGSWENPGGYDFAGAKQVVVGGLEPIPGWVKRTRMFGDVRMRYDSTRFPNGNDNTGSFPNFNLINRGAPFDVAGFEFSPQFNVDEDRKRFRLRARLGLESDLGNGFMIGFRGATGNDNRGISVNQTLTGNFPKYEIWLDQAFVRWDGAIGSVPAYFVAGRFENPFFPGRINAPFFRNSDIVWDYDLMFDGAAFGVTPELSDRFGLFATVGAFPLYNTPFTSPDNQPDKFPSQDRYLHGYEGGFHFTANRNIDGIFAVGYHDFNNVEGELSDPYVPLTPRDAGNTDDRRPPFAQKGNTYMPLRNITPDPLNDFGTSKQYQYFGLATPFQVLTYNGRVDFNHWEPYQISLFGDYAKNVAFDRDRLEALAVNNRGPVKADGSPGAYEGGDTAWSAMVQFGKPEFQKLGDWNTSLGYRYIESDAVVDGLNVSDFGLGGSNMEGPTIGANIALSRNVFVHLRWMSATEIAGPQFKSNIFFFDFNAEF